MKYKETGPMLNDLWGHNIAFAHIDPVTARWPPQDRQASRACDLATERLASLPDIPSARKPASRIPTSSPGGRCTCRRARRSRSSTSSRRWFNEIAVDDDTKKFLANLGSDPFPGNSQMLKDLLVKDTKAWGEYVKIAKIEPYS